MSGRYEIIDIDLERLTLISQRKGKGVNGYDQFLEINITDSLYILRSVYTMKTINKYTNEEFDLKPSKDFKVKIFQGSGVMEVAVFERQQEILVFRKKLVKKKYYFIIEKYGFNGQFIDLFDVTEKLNSKGVFSPFSINCIEMEKGNYFVSGLTQKGYFFMRFKWKEVISIYFLKYEAVKGYDKYMTAISRLVIHDLIPFAKGDVLIFESIKYTSITYYSYSLKTTISTPSGIRNNAFIVIRFLDNGEIDWVTQGRLWTEHHPYLKVENVYRAPVKKFIKYVDDPKRQQIKIYAPVGDNLYSVDLSYDGSKSEKEWLIENESESNSLFTPWYGDYYLESGRKEDIVEKGKKKTSIFQVKKVYAK